MPSISLEASLAYRIHRLQRLLRRHWLQMAAAQGYDLTPEQFFLLNKLVDGDGVSQTALTDEALQDRANLTRMLRDMESKGLVARRGDPEDARKRLVHLTRKGLDLHASFVEDVIEPARDKLFGGLPAETIAHTQRAFDHLEEQI